MATKAAIAGCWGILEASGLPRPWATADEAEAALSAWALVLADTSDERLLACTAAWLRSAEVRYGRWPMPGALLHALPDPAGVDDADEAWAECLGLIRLLGCERCPGDAAGLADLRERATAGHREAMARSDGARAERYRRVLASLPRADAARDAALLAGVAACGGWRALGRASDEAMAAHRASFRAAYRGQRQRATLTATERQVAGLLGDAYTPRHLRLVDGEGS